MRSIAALFAIPVVALLLGACLAWAGGTAWPNPPVPGSGGGNPPPPSTDYP